MQETTSSRTMGLPSAIGVGVGAIVGGGILALAGAAFAATGPSAILAFTLNGVIAVLTALSFAEVSSKFPESGGTYVFAKKVLSVEAAFAVGWIVWFASIVAAVLYAIGFASFAAVAVTDLLAAFTSQSAGWLTGRVAITALALGSTWIYTASLLRHSAGGGNWINIAKVVVFGILILGGLGAAARSPVHDLSDAFTPFFEQGAAGLFQAMGFSFIALQGFDLIAAVAGEVRNPERVLPRAMLGSLAIALLIYLPLLAIMTTVGSPGDMTVSEISQNNPDTMVAVAARNYLGSFGYWLVIVAAILSMLSALQANLFAASRVAAAMARDRTLPAVLARISPRSGTPHAAILATAAITTAILLVMSNVAAAGAASSLIFLITFALAHGIAILVRRRSRHRPPPFRSPWFPAVPLSGGLACLALAIYQGFAVPAAGLITATWLGAGGLFFLALLKRRARIADASSAALDPELERLRGRSPLVLVPVANPQTARGLASLADILAPPDVGRVLLLSVIVASKNWRPREDRGPLARTEQVWSEAIAASVDAGTLPESLTTVAEEPWREIARVARAYHCESLLLGLSRLDPDSKGLPLNALLGRVDSDIVVLRAPPTWHPNDARRILVATGGRGGHDQLLARLLGSLARIDSREVTFLRVLGVSAGEREQAVARAALRRVARDLCPTPSQIEVLRHNQPVQAVAEAAEASDLTILGMQRVNRYQKVFGDFSLEIARQTNKPLLLISRRG